MTYQTTNDIEGLQDTVENLRNVISWSLFNSALTAGQRILCHQKIANLLSIIEALRGDTEAPQPYHLPPALEEKVQHIFFLIWTKNWERPEIKY